MATVRARLARWLGGLRAPVATPPTVPWQDGRRWPPSRSDARSQPPPEPGPEPER
jgi:hypothetical protein